MDALVRSAGAELEHSPAASRGPSGGPARTLARAFARGRSAASTLGSPDRTARGRHPRRRVPRRRPGAGGRLAGGDHGVLPGHVSLASRVRPGNGRPGSLAGCRRTVGDRAVPRGRRGEFYDRRLRARQPSPARFTALRGRLTDCPRSRDRDRRHAAHRINAIPVDNPGWPQAADGGDRDRDGQIVHPPWPSRLCVRLKLS